MFAHVFRFKSQLNIIYIDMLDTGAMNLITFKYLYE